MVIHSALTRKLTVRVSLGLLFNSPIVLMVKPFTCNEDFSVRVRVGDHFRTNSSDGNTEDVSVLCSNHS